MGKNKGWAEGGLRSFCPRIVNSSTKSTKGEQPLVRGVGRERTGHAYHVTNVTFRVRKLGGRRKKRVDSGGS